MTLGQDDLTRPLGLETATHKRRRVGLAFSQVFVGCVATLFLVLAGWLAFVKDPFGGEPYAIAPVERRAAEIPEAVRPSAGSNVSTVAGTEPAASRSSAAEMETASGVRVTRGSGEAPPSVVIRVPDAAIKLAAAPDSRLVERVRQGNLPRIGADGARPSEVDARRAASPPPKLAGRIAIVVVGLGISATSTADAIAKLPPEVTLAFAPYGAEVDKQVVRARDDGHEVMLQAPMEPFDYPENDPGPHTLTANGAPQETMDRLHFVMSRFSGYVGIMNYMGAKFTANEAALAPVLREIASRGLFFLDDGSSPRSLVPTVAATAKLQAGRADLVVDGVARAPSIDAQLARLEATAREKGVAIGSASALPLSVDRIAQWAKTLEAKGIQLVPVSAVIGKPGRA